MLKNTPMKQELGNGGSTHRIPEPSAEDGEHAIWQSPEFGLVQLSTIYWLKHLAQLNVCVCVQPRSQPRLPCQSRRHT